MEDTEVGYMSDGYNVTLVRFINLLRSLTERVKFKRELGRLAIAEGNSILDQFEDPPLAQVLIAAMFAAANKTALHMDSATRLPVAQFLYCVGQCADDVNDKRLYKEAMAMWEFVDKATDGDTEVS